MLLKADAFSELSAAFKKREKEPGRGLPLMDFIDMMLPRIPKPNSMEGAYRNQLALFS